MTTIATTSRPFAGEDDLAPVVAFLNLVEETDRIDEGSTVEELRQDLSDPDLDTARSVRLWHDEAGRIVAFAELWDAEETADNDAFMWYKVHPDHRDGALEAEMFAWGEGLARERGRAILRLVARDVEASRIATFERHGFAPARYFLRMARDLHAPIPEPALPEGYTLRAEAHELQAWVDLYNESFVDHFNFHPLTVEKLAHYREEPDYRPELDLVAYAPDGAAAAFAWCIVHAAENGRTGRNDGWITDLGTRRGHRGRGLGRAVLLAGLKSLRDAGVDRALLGVDAASPTGATRLYESAGFRTIYTRILYGRDIPA